MKGSDAREEFVYTDLTTPSSRLTDDFRCPPSPPVESPTLGRVLPSPGRRPRGRQGCPVRELCRSSTTARRADREREVSSDSLSIVAGSDSTKRSSTRSVSTSSSQQPPRGVHLVPVVAQHLVTPRQQSFPRLGRCDRQLRHDRLNTMNECRPLRVADRQEGTRQRALRDPQRPGDISDRSTRRLDELQRVPTVLIRILVQTTHDGSFLHGLPRIRDVQDSGAGSASREGRQPAPATMTTRSTTGSGQSTGPPMCRGNATAQMGLDLVLVGRVITATAVNQSTTRNETNEKKAWPSRSLATELARSRC